MIVVDLHEHSPFAKSEKSMQSLKSQQSVQSQPPVQLQTPVLCGMCRFTKRYACGDSLRHCLHDKGRVFSRPPRHHEFRRLILRPEFKTIVFHRMVDIGRCSKCEYHTWKCATVPVDLHAIWQDALSHHHLLHIQQKKCYAADWGRAAVDFPRSELYLPSQHQPSSQPPCVSQPTWAHVCLVVRIQHHNLSGDRRCVYCLIHCL
jgi:hypothetical protein